MIPSLIKKGDEVYFYHYNHTNSVEVEELQKYSPVESNVFENGEVLKPDKWNIICGSIYMIAEVLGKL